MLLSSIAEVGTTAGLGILGLKASGAALGITGATAGVAGAAKGVGVAAKAAKIGKAAGAAKKLSRGKIIARELKRGALNWRYVFNIRPKRNRRSE